MKKGLLAVALACTAACSAAEGPATERRGQPIVDGYADDKDLAVVALSIHHASGPHCTGTLIAPNLVLTARHCVANTTGEDADQGIVCGQTKFLTAAPGEVFLVAPDDTHSYMGTGTVRVPDDSQFCGNDIALIRLEGKGVPADVAQPFVPRLVSQPRPAEVYSAVGYGLTSPSGGTSGDRMRVDESTVECSAGGCEGPVASLLTNAEWLGTARTCPGDSGGPALDSGGRVMGVLSRGPDGCVKSVYTDVTAWADLLRKVGLEAAATGDYDAPFWATEEQTLPLGLPCDGPCEDGYACLSPNQSTTRGICVPTCTAATPDCPSGFHCDLNLKVCSNLSAATPSKSDGGGCTIAAGEAGRGGGGFAALAFATFGLFSWRRLRQQSRDEQ